MPPDVGGRLAWAVASIGMAGLLSTKDCCDVKLFRAEEFISSQSWKVA
jgi:hypothetical protein